MKTRKRNCVAVSALIALLCAGTAYAAECKLPKNCTYLDSEFSTGGGKKLSYVMEVTCKMPDKKITKYTDWEVSVGGVFGVGRLTMPRKVVFVAGKKDELECDY